MSFDSLQGLPERFLVDSSRRDPHRIYHQLGNMVCPPVIAAVANGVAACLDGSHPGALCML
jgi:site-specific DNA-cytosine methylase